MSPVNRSDLSDAQVWSEIQYLDPDLKGLKKCFFDFTMDQKHARKPLVAGIIALVTLAGALAVRCFHIVAKIMH